MNAHDNNMISSQATIGIKIDKIDKSCKSHQVAYML